MSRTLPTLALAAGLMAGCGGATSPHRDAGRPGFLSHAQAERALDSSFRRALYRLAVMTQPGDDPADLGQSLPTGVVAGTACRPAAGHGLHCRVAWRAVDGGERTTHYRVALTGEGCLYANARPALEQIHDVTTEAPAESPLGFLVSALPGC